MSLWCSAPTWLLFTLCSPTVRRPFPLRDPPLASLQTQVTFLLSFRHRLTQTNASVWFMLHFQINTQAARVFQIKSTSFNLQIRSDRVSPPCDMFLCESHLYSRCVQDSPHYLLPRVSWRHDSDSPPTWLAVSQTQTHTHCQSDGIPRC